MKKMASSPQNPSGQTAAPAHWAQRTAFIRQRAAARVATIAVALGMVAAPVAAEPYIPETLAAEFEVLDEHAQPMRISVDYLTPPGRLYDVNGHKIHMFCVGQGAPTVILEAGLGGFSLEWLSVQQKLAGSARVCAYDRAGYGWSQLGPLPRTTDVIIDELHQLTRVARLQPPFVLVGHSFGGYVVQAFARRWPELTAGIVLVDSSHPEQDRYLPSAREAARTRPAPGVRVHKTSRPVVPLGYPEEVRNIAYYLMGTRKAARTQREELRFMSQSGREVISAGPIPDGLHAAVVSRSFEVGGQTVLSGHSADEGLERTWQSLQSNLGHLYGTEKVDARFSGHFVHLDQPWLVVDSIERVIGQSCADDECVTAALPATVTLSVGAVPTAP